MKCSRNYSIKIMKKIVFILVLFFCTTFAFSQNIATKKIEKVGSLFEVTIYYGNGNIMQHGFLTPENKLHAQWESYDEKGNKQCVATYENGVKIGIWYYYKDNQTTRVIYDKNKIVKVEKLDSLK